MNTKTGPARRRAFANSNWKLKTEVTLWTVIIFSPVSNIIAAPKSFLEILDYYRQLLVAFAAGFITAKHAKPSVLQLEYLLGIWS
jgi:hypothetical protein